MQHNLYNNTLTLSPLGVKTSETMLSGTLEESRDGKETPVALHVPLFFSHSFPRFLRDLSLEGR